MSEYKYVEKRVRFAKPAPRATQFRSDCPISEELRKKLVHEVHDDALAYIWERHYAFYHMIICEYMDKCNVRPEKRQSLQKNVFWWNILMDVGFVQERSPIEEYIAEKQTIEVVPPVIKSWLRAWNKSTPQFYYVGFKYNDRNLLLLDIPSQKTVDVRLTDPATLSPDKGQIITGALIPMGDSLYFPIIDFYHFDLATSRKIAGHIHYFYDMYSKGSNSLIDVYIDVLSTLLHIEHRIFLEKSAEISSE